MKSKKFQFFFKSISLALEVTELKASFFSPDNVVKIYLSGENYLTLSGSKFESNALLARLRQSQYLPAYLSVD